jgi:hypothetical protein
MARKVLAMLVHRAIQSFPARLQFINSALGEERLFFSMADEFKLTTPFHFSTCWSNDFTRASQGMHRRQCVGWFCDSACCRCTVASELFLMELFGTAMAYLAAIGSKRHGQ